MATLGQVLKEGKCWDAMPLATRHSIAIAAKLPHAREVALILWQNLSLTYQDAIYKLDWTKF